MRCGYSSATSPVGIRKSYDLERRDPVPFPLPVRDDPETGERNPILQTNYKGRHITYIFMD